MKSIDDLLNNLHSTKHLSNNSDTWSRIGSRDSFDELGLPNSELDEFLKNWINDNPYSSI